MSRWPPDTDAGVSETTPSPRARRTKQLLLVIVALILGAVVWRIVADFSRPADPTERRVRRLLHRTKAPGLVGRLLVRVGLRRKYESQERTLQELVDLGEAAVPHLARILAASDEDQTMRLRAGLALGRIGTPAAPEQAVPVLMRTLRDKDSRVAERAAEVLGVYGPAAKDAVGLLVESLRHEDSDLRSSAASSLARIGPPAVGALIAALDSDNVDMRVGAALALSGMKSVPKAAALALIRGMADENSRFRVYAALTLSEMDTLPKAAAPALIRVMADEDSDVRGFAAMALGRVTPAAREAIPTLRKALKDQDAAVCEFAAEALEKIEKNTPTKPGGER